MNLSFFFLLFAFREFKQFQHFLLHFQHDTFCFKFRLNKLTDERKNEQTSAAKCEKWTLKIALRVAALKSALVALAAKLELGSILIFCEFRWLLEQTLNGNIMNWELSWRKESNGMDAELVFKCCPPTSVTRWLNYFVRIWPFS